MDKNIYSLNKTLMLSALALVSGFSVSAQYCTPTFASGCVKTTGSPASAIIDGVVTTNGITNFSNTGTGCPNTTTSYSDYTATNMVVTQDAFKSVDVQINYDDGGTGALGYLKLWVDWNQDDVFDDATERVFPAVANDHAVGGSLGSSKTIKVDVPGYAKNGLTRMRIMVGSQGSIWNAGYDACGFPNTVDVGEAEDYNFEVVNPCVAPSDIDVIGIDFKEATITWRSVLNSEFYEYIITTADTIPDPDVFGFYYTTDSVMKIDTFQCGVKYYVLVRSICDTTDVGPTPHKWDISGWYRDSFTTDECCYDPEVTISQVSSTFALAKWNPVNTSVGYEYVVSTQATEPTGKGTFVQTTTVPLQGLNPRTRYYFYLRSLCDPTPESGWTSETFKTDPPLTVGGVDAEELRIDAYPNPMSDVLHIKLDGAISSGAQITIFDITGKAVYHSSIESNSIEVDTRNFTSGIYMIKYTDATHNGVIKITK